MRMLSRKDLNSAELETIKVSENPTTVMTANGDTRQCCVSWCPACHGKERFAGRQMDGVARTQVSPRSTEANQIPRHPSPATRNPAKTTDRSYRDFCHRRLSSRTAHTRGESFTTSQAIEGILCADQTSFACAGVPETECAIFPIRELAAFGACEHLRSGERPSARRSLPAQVLFDEFSWQPDPVP